jgi:cytochrome c oxidase cbb3-type subunit I/II
MQTLGVPYADGYDKKAVADLQAQAKEVAKPLYDNIDALLITDETFDKVKSGEMKFEEMEMVALIAYLQRLGTDIYPKKEVAKNDTLK